MLTGANKLVSIQHSLQTKLTFSFIILILLIAGMTFIYTYGETKNALKASIRDELIEIAGSDSTQINGDQVAEIKAGDEGSQKYLAIRDELWKLRSRSTVTKNLYLFRVNNSNLEFIVDDLYGIDPDYAKTGESYDSPDHDLIIGAQSNATASNEFYTDKWGTFLSGYAPVTDSKGNVVAVLGVDMRADNVIARENFIGNTIYLILAISIIIAGCMIAFFSRTIIRDIKKLNASAEKISLGDMDVMVDVERKDEIGELAHSFSRMVTSLKIMMMHDDKKE